MSHRILKSTNHHDFFRANLCVCACSSTRIHSTCCHFYFLSLPDTAIWASVCSSSFIFLVFAHPVSTYTICLRRCGKVPGKNTHLLYHHSQQGCVCKRQGNRKIKGDREMGGLWEIRFPVFPNDQHITCPLISLVASQGIWIIHNTSMGTGLPSVCLSAAFCTNFNLVRPFPGVKPYLDHPSYQTVFINWHRCFSCADTSSEPRPADSISRPTLVRVPVNYWRRLCDDYRYLLQG